MLSFSLIKQIFNFAKSYNKLTYKGSNIKNGKLEVHYGVSGKRCLDKTEPLETIEISRIKQFDSESAYTLGALQAIQHVDLNKNLETLKLKFVTSKYFILLSVFFVTILCVATVMATRLINLPVFNYFTPMPGAIVIFPFSFYLMDVICEVYGYPYARRLIWSSILCQFLFSLLCNICMLIPSVDPSGNTDMAFKTVIGLSLPLAIGSLLGISAGLFINCFVLEKLKEIYDDKHLWLRTNVATFVGEFVYTIIWTSIVFVISMGKLNMMENFKMTIAIVLAKMLYEMVLTPFVYIAVDFLKNNEVYKRKPTRSYNPFKWSLK